MNDMVLCPLVDRQIDIVDCMENQAIREEYIPGGRFEIVTDRDGQLKRAIFG